MTGFISENKKMVVRFTLALIALLALSALGSAMMARVSSSSTTYTSKQAKLGGCARISHNIKASKSTSSKNASSN